MVLSHQNHVHLALMHRTLVTAIARSAPVVITIHSQGHRLVQYVPLGIFVQIVLSRHNHVPLVLMHRTLAAAIARSVPAAIII